MDEVEMKNKFNAFISELISKKRSDNKSFLTQEEYRIRLEQLNHAKFVLKTPGAKKSTKDYRMVRKYDTLTINGTERLVKPVVGDAVLHYVTIDELFDILHWTHLDIGHGGRNRMDLELKSKYCNITNETIMAYLSLCTHCQKKSYNSRTSLVSKPVLHSTSDSRVQIDLIDMQSKHNVNGFRFILIYEDHLTKFIILKALTSKFAMEIAQHLLDIFTTFGAPAILQSDSQEFEDSSLDLIITELHSLWSDMKIVRGKSQRSQSQKTVNQSSKDVKGLLTTWMKQNVGKDWSIGLKFIQFQKNNTLNLDIGKTPFEAMFGCTLRVGITSTGEPVNEIIKLSTKEDVEIIQSEESNTREENDLSTRS